MGAQWPRACALLIRLALEMTPDRFWAREAWLGLAGAAHHHAYELVPTGGGVAGWLTEVTELAGLLLARQPRPTFGTA